MAKKQVAAMVSDDLYGRITEAKGEKSLNVWLNEAILAHLDGPKAVQVPISTGQGHDFQVGTLATVPSNPIWDSLKNQLTEVNA